MARSPIAPAPPEAVVAGWVVSGRRSTATLTLTDQTPLAKVAVKASWDGAMAEILGVRFGRSTRLTGEHAGSGWDALLVGSGPGEWLVLAEPGQETSVVAWLERAAGRAGELVTVIDLTHGRALVRLTGERSRDLLAKECGADLTDAICPDGSALRSAVAGVATDLVRDDEEGMRSYVLHCERSSGQFLFDALVDAGGEYDVEVSGFAPPRPDPKAR